MTDNWNPEIRFVLMTMTPTYRGIRGNIKIRIASLSSRFEGKFFFPEKSIRQGNWMDNYDARDRRLLGRGSRSPQR